MHGALKETLWFAVKLLGLPSIAFIFDRWSIVAVMAMNSHRRVIEERLVSNLMRMRVATPSSALQAVAEVDDLEDEAVVDKAA